MTVTKMSKMFIKTVLLFKKHIQIHPKYVIDDYTLSPAYIGSDYRQVLSKLYSKTKITTSVEPTITRKS